MQMDIDSFINKNQAFVCMKCFYAFDNFLFTYSKMYIVQKVILMILCTGNVASRPSHSTVNTFYL